jgi:cell division protein FtsB
VSAVAYPGGVRAWGRRLGPAVVVVLLLGTLFLAIFPTPAYLNQRQSLDTAQTRLEVLTRENGRLEEKVGSLRTEEEIERLAREQFNLVRPGEEAYAILPPPVPTPGIDALAEFLRSLRLWP